MLAERISAVVEEMAEVESINEVLATYEHWKREAPECVADPTCMAALMEAAVRMKDVPKPNQYAEKCETAKVPAQPSAPKPPVQRAERKYRLLKKEVAWTQKPQVLAIMDILCAHMEVGDALPEGDIVRAMVANGAILRTRQPIKRIWDYYKGNSEDGLITHGNIELVR